MGESRYLNDFAIAHYHTLGFMAEEELNTHLKNICTSLKEGGKFLLRTAGPQIISSIKQEKIREWAEKNNQFILSEKYIEDGYRIEKCITIDIYQQHTEKVANWVYGEFGKDKPGRTLDYVIDRFKI